MLALIALALVSSCSAEQPANGVENYNKLAQLELRDLPSIKRSGTSYPYIRYSEATGREETRGQIFYLYPTTRRKNELVSVEYIPGSKTEGLVSDEILGSAGLIVEDKGIVVIDFLPISLPRDMSSRQMWKMHYAGRNFICRGNRVSEGAQHSYQLDVACSDGRYVLQFSFDPQRGVTEYQDFCRNSICTFRLTDSVGLLSSATLKHMGLPKI